MMQRCPECSGQKQVACEECDGAGEKNITGPEGETTFKTCRECGGTGWVDCPRCSGLDGPPGDTRDFDQMRRGESMF